MNSNNFNIAIIGLGYVGLPLYFAFSKYFSCTGFDINKKKINELQNNNDQNKQFTKKDFKNKKNLNFSTHKKDIKNCNTYIVTVPTPINNSNQPDLRALKKSCKLIASILKKNDLIIFESTVYPGVTNDICIPLLEKISGYKINIDFEVGYSPERINPGDKIHTLETIPKIISGSSKKTAKKLKFLYSKIISATLHVASSIVVAESSKIIENVQRDVNIAYINEISIIFKKMKIDTEEILKLSSTKWNFLNFKPGLVGGHCIGVDPFYLMYKATRLKYSPKIIEYSRRLNDSLGLKIAKEIEILANKTKNNKILIMGAAFKENCPDFRNSKIVDIYKYLIKNNYVNIYDPNINSMLFKKYYNINLLEEVKKNYYDIIIIAVAHNVFKKIGIKNIRQFGKKNSIVYDVKWLFKKKDTDFRL